MSGWREYLASLRPEYQSAENANDAKASNKAGDSGCFGTIGTVGTFGILAFPEKQGDPANDNGPEAPCPECAGRLFWRLSWEGGPWACSCCCPPPDGAWVDACCLPPPRAGQGGSKV